MPKKMEIDCLIFHKTYYLFNITINTNNLNDFPLNWRQSIFKVVPGTVYKAKCLHRHSYASIWYMHHITHNTAKLDS